MGILSFVYYILTVAGLWKVYTKCGEEGWWSLIPFFRNIKLGEIAGRRDAGYLFAVMSLITAVLRGAVNDNGRYGFLVGILAFVVGLVSLIAMVRVYDGMCRRFRRGQGWIFGWILFGGITSIIWGFMDEFQPVRDGESH